MDQTAFMIGFTVILITSLAIYATGKKTPPSHHHTWAPPNNPGAMRPKVIHCA